MFKTRTKSKTSVLVTTLVLVGILGAAAWVALPMINKNQIGLVNKPTLCVPNVIFTWPSKLVVDGGTKDVSLEGNWKKLVLTPENAWKPTEHHPYDGTDQYVYEFELNTVNFGDCDIKDAEIAILFDDKEQSVATKQVFPAHSNGKHVMHVMVSNNGSEFNSDYNRKKINFEIRNKGIVIAQSFMFLEFSGFGELNVSKCINKLKTPTGKNQLVASCVIKATKGQGSVNITNFPLKVIPNNLNLTNWKAAFTMANQNAGRPLTVNTQVLASGSYIVTPKLSAGWNENPKPEDKWLPDYSGPLTNYLALGPGGEYKIDFYADTELEDVSKSASVGFEIPAKEYITTSALKILGTFPNITQNSILNVK